MHRLWRLLDRSALGLAVFLVVDRLVKFAAVVHFFQQKPATPPERDRPTVTMFYPITRGVADLPRALCCRAQLNYQGSVQHLLVCDAADSTSLSICHAWRREHGHLNAEVVSVQVAGRRVASKIEKLNAALPQASGDIFCFVDDDVFLRSHTLPTLITYLLQPHVGAVFGLACYTAWHNLSTSLMSAFVNINALISYIPLTYMTEPFTITGHCFAMRRTVFVAAHGLEGMDQRLDDDHELARRVRRLGLRCVQTPLIYDVENHFDALTAYAKQMKRWFVIPRQVIVPALSLREKLATTIGGLGTLLLPALALSALLSRRSIVKQAFAGVMVLCNIIFWISEACYLGRRTPWQRWPLLSVAALVTPVQILAALLANSEIEWRGQRLRLQRGGRIEYLMDER